MKKTLIKKFTQMGLFLLTMSCIGCGQVDPSDPTTSDGGSTSTPTTEPTSDPTSTPTTDPTIEPPVTKEEYLLYNLKFNKDSINKNEVSNHFEHAILHGDKYEILDEQHKGNNVIKFNNTERQNTYLELPKEVLDNDVTTISSWVYLPKNIADFNAQSPIFSIKYEDGYFTPSPFDPGTWYGYSMYSKLPNREAKKYVVA